MLYLDVARLCADKGIQLPKKFLIGIGFQPRMAAELLRGKRVRMDYEQVEKLCVALRCTPNDLLSWQPGTNTQVDTGHPLHALVRQKRVSFPEMLQSMSAEQIEEMRGILEARMKQA